MKEAPIFFSEIIYFGEKARVGCDAKCNKAFGMNLRPTSQRSNNEDDWEFLADDELEVAPAVTGETEDSVDKPLSLSEAHNKWCVRQCERSSVTSMHHPEEAIDILDFSRRVSNIKQD